MIGLSKEIHFNKCKDGKGFVNCHYWYFDNRVKFQRILCNGCCDVLIMNLGINNIAVITVRSIDYLSEANLKLLICQKIMCLITKDLCKIISKEFNIKNRKYNYYRNLVKADDLKKLCEKL